MTSASPRHPGGLADTPNSNVSDLGLVPDTKTVRQYSMPCTEEKALGILFPSVTACVRC